MKWSPEKERLLLAQGCRDSFRLFVKYAFGIYGYRDPNNQGRRWWCEETHGPFCDWLGQKGLEWLASRDKNPPERTYIEILVSRDGGKTIICTKAFQLWLHLHDPDLATVTDTSTATKALNFASHIKAVLEGRDPYALFPWLYGNWKGEDLWTKDAFTHAARRANRTEPSFSTSSVETGVTGYHPDAIFLDDPVDEEKIKDGSTWLMSANRHVRSIYPALLPNSLLVLVGTPYVDGDPATRAIRVDGIKSCAGAELPEEFQRHVHDEGRWHLFFFPGRDGDGTPLLPRVWPEHEMTDYQRRDPANYASQVMLCPGTGDMVPLSFSRLEEMIVDEVPENLAYSFHFDTAFKSPERIGTGDESVIEVWGHEVGTGKVYFIEGYGSNRWKMEDFIEKVIWLAKKYDGKRIIGMTDERGVGGKEGVWDKSLAQAFRAAGLLRPRFVELTRPTNIKKEDRIISTIWYWTDNYVHLLRTAPGLPKLMDQMSRITVSEKRDWADAAADVFSPEIYRPLRTNDEEQPPDPARPYDEYLLGRSVSDVLRLYDEQHQAVDFVDARTATDPYTSRRGGGFW